MDIFPIMDNNVDNNVTINGKVLMSTGQVDDQLCDKSQTKQVDLQNRDDLQDLFYSTLSALY